MRLKKEESYWLKPSVATTGRYLLPPEARTLSSPGTQSTTRISPWQFMVFADPATAGRWHDGHIPTAAGSSTQATGTDPRAFGLRLETVIPADLKQRRTK
ncbi:uncharacterized protein LOC144288028 isoform X4 [Canis aureus]